MIELSPIARMRTPPLYRLQPPEYHAPFLALHQHGAELDSDSTFATTAPIFRGVSSVKRPTPPSPFFDPYSVLSPFIIRGLATRKGLTVDSVSTGKGGRRFVRFTDGKGTVIDRGRLNGFTLYEAKMYLDQLPDRKP